MNTARGIDMTRNIVTTIVSAVLSYKT